MRPVEKKYSSIWMSAVNYAVAIMIVNAFIMLAVLGLEYYTKGMYIFIYIALILLSIASFVMTLWNVKQKKEFQKKLLELSADNFLLNKKIDLQDIKEAIKKEGYIPQDGSEDNELFFKISDEPFVARYENECLCIRRHYNIGEGTNIKAIRAAAIQTEEELYLTKIYVPTHDDGTSSIVFEVPLFINSAVELMHHFPRCLNLILNSIQRHREIYNKIQEDLAIGQRESKVVS